ncbi:MAG: FGGY-family carbohydrate kinase [Cypionkella sp.]|uniref:FGGY-family carbohydrate kinase n=1 Tax=Cypionkella sp. TaxID=2811411 RepID=UPI002ABCB7C7|nr:FGGY-family carbohydrate kinase [Cypionkella sp.]MDZ4311629.1 FGGY-family carbohydrate kinase [Cypionkella sp.]
MTSLLGIDNGLTVTKAVIFDETGRQLSVARRRIPQLLPQPHHVERDMEGLWRATAEAIAEAIQLSGRPASDIVAVAATAHGDGLYLLDHENRPLGNGILSLDGRAGAICESWRDRADAALKLTGQIPPACSPAALLAWVRDNEPERFAQIGSFLACKDWLRFCLTGSLGTDRTEASTAFTDVQTQDYTLDALQLFGLENVAHALPDIADSAEIIGHITPEAAALTGLVAGTPVAAGLHDVTASALGIGGHAEGVVAIVAGTYSINEVVSAQPNTDPRWLCRNAILPGQWNNMALSPASAANYDWFIETLCEAELTEADTSGTSIHAMLALEIDAALAKPTTLMFHPFLYGSPHGPQASASFLGLRGWHNRGDMLRAVLEGIVFNHRSHIDALRAGFPVREARLTGGVARNPTFAQMFADILGMPVTTSQTEEAAAWGAALCAGAAVGLYASPLADPRDMSLLGQTYTPDPARAATYEKRFQLYQKITAAVAPLWPEIEALIE